MPSPPRKKKKKTSTKTRLTLLRDAKLAQFAWLRHGFSTRHGGCSEIYGGKALNLGFTSQDSPSAVERNRAKLLRALDARNGQKLWPLITLRQVHSDLIHRVDGPPKAPPAGDGLITATPGLALAIQTADCLPVLLVDVKRRAIGVFHAGWRGTLQRIVEKGLGEMRRHFGTLPRDVRAAIGPGIHRCCYEVGPEVKSQFLSQFDYAEALFHEIRESDSIREKYPLLFLTARAPGHSELPAKMFLDLVEANRRQLLSAGVAAKNIGASPLCTACRSDLLFSYRAEKAITGRMMAVAGMQP